MQGTARILECIVFYGLLGIVALTAIPYGTVEPWWVAVFECLVFLLGILAIIEASINRTGRANRFALSAPLIVLTLFILLQSLPLFSRANLAASLSADAHGSRLFAIKLFALITTGVVLARYTSTRSRLRTLVVAVISIGVASAVFGLVRKNMQHTEGFFLPALTIDDRNFGQFINKNHFAFLMEMSLGLTLSLLFMGLKDPRRLLVLFPLTAALWTALVISNSRGGVLGSLCEVLFLGVMLDPVGRLRRKYSDLNSNRLRAFAGGFVLRGLLIVCLVVVFGYGVAWIGGEPVVNNLNSAPTDFGQSGAINDANTSRRQMWMMTWKMFTDHPVAGIGFGGYWIAITKYHNASGELTPQEAHNDYLDFLAAGGLIGFAMVGWFLVVFLRRARASLRSPDAYCRAACLGALAGIFGVAVHSFVDFGLHITVNALAFTVLIVIATANIRIDQPKPAS